MSRLEAKRAAFEAIERAKCRSKRAYTSKANAQQAKRRARQLRGAAVVVYRCPWCALWHLTSTKARALAKRDQELVS